MSLDEENTTSTDVAPDEAQSFNEEGDRCFREGKYDQAVEWFKRTINKEPPADTALRLAALEDAAWALTRSRYFDEADEMVQKALDLLDGTPSGGVLLRQGWLAFYQKSYAQAFARFADAEKKLEADNKDGARIGLLASRQQLDVLSPQSGEAAAKQLVAKWLNEGVPKSNVVQVFIECSAVFERLNLYPAALNNAEQLLGIDENNKEGIYLKIGALKWLRRYAKAERTYHDAPLEVRTNLKVWNELANTYYEQKRFRDAYEHYSGEVLDKRPSLSDAEKRLKRLLQEDVRALDIDDDDDETLTSVLDAREWTIVSLRKMRKFPEARIKVNEALSSVRQKLKFLSEQASMYFAARDYDNAIRLFDRAIEIDDYDTFALGWRAACLRKKGDFTKAKEEIDKALRKVPYSTGLLEERGWQAFDQGKFEEANAAFDKAIELDPYLINRQFGKVEALVRLNRSEDALNVFKELQQQFPDDAEITEQLCWFYIRAGQLELAREQQIKLKQCHPHSVLALNALGGYELAQRNYPQAEEVFRQALKEVDYEPQYHINLAWALIRQVKAPGELAAKEISKRQKLIDDAKESCWAALKLDSFNAKAYECLGVIAFRQDAFLDAKAYFLKSLEVNPLEGSYVELGSLYCRMGDYDEAAKTLQEALKRNPADARVYIELGNVFVQRGDNKEAVRLCREAVHVEPQNPETHRALAIALMRSEQYEEAESLVRRALITLPQSKRWRLHLLLAQILVRAGDLVNKDRKKKDLYSYEEALRCVNEARQSSPPNADICFHAGIVQYRLEDYSTAQQNFFECLKLNRDRFDAERNSRIVQATLDQQNRFLKVNEKFGYLLAAICILMLAALWIPYFRGHTRTLQITPSSTSTPPANSNTAAPTPAPTPQFTVDAELLKLMTPMLLGLLAIAALLPNLSKLKMPGFEAEVREPAPAEPNISLGPRGDIGFGSSLPIISPEPR